MRSTSGDSFWRRWLSGAKRSAVVLVAKGDAALVEAEQAAVRDGDAVGVAGEIGEHRLGPGEGRLGVDEPVLSAEWREARGKGPPATQAFDLAEEHQPAGMQPKDFMGTMWALEACVGAGHVALLLADIRPDLVNLNKATGQLAHLLVHELR